MGLCSLSDEEAKVVGSRKQETQEKMWCWKALILETKPVL